MKKQNKSNWLTIVFTIIAAVVFMFAANSPAAAQPGNYKVGDRVELMAEGEWIKAKILEAKDGLFKIHYEVSYYRPDIWVEPKYLRRIAADVQTNNQNNTANQVQNQPNGNNRTANQTTEQKARQATKTNRFGARDARTCDDTKAPAKGAITAALAQKYLNCQMEGIWSNDLYLVENVKVEVGGGVPYTPNLGAFDSINVRVPLYPIRGSFLKYQCQDPETAYVGPPNTNCVTYNNPKATGYCYKTTFGDWKCNMADRSATEKENYRAKVAPPKP